MFKWRESCSQIKTGTVTTAVEGKTYAVNNCSLSTPISPSQTYKQSTKCSDK